MKTITKQIKRAPLSSDFLFVDENDGVFDDNWLVSANDLFGSFSLMGDGPDHINFYDQAA